MARKKAQRPAQPTKNDLIDQLENYLSETVPYVTHSIKERANTFIQHPKESLDQLQQAANRFQATARPKAQRYFRETVVPKAKSSVQFVTDAYHNGDMKKLASHAMNFVKDHPYTAGALGAGVLAARYISPSVSVVAGLGLIAKVIYDKGEMNIGFDSDVGKVGVKVRVGPNKRR